MADSESPTPPGRADERLLDLRGLPASQWTREQEDAYQAAMARADADLYERAQRRRRTQHAA